MYYDAASGGPGQWGEAKGKRIGLSHWQRRRTPPSWRVLICAANVDRWRLVCLAGWNVASATVGVMANWFRLWEKKRGLRRTGSRLAASTGEWLFFAGLFLAGAMSLTAVVGAQLWHLPEVEPYLSGWSFWLVLLVVLSFVAVGVVGMAYTLFQAGTSAERRAARG
jgi:hypothetical protein